MLIFGHLIALAIALNWVRFKISPFWNRLLLSIGMVYFYSFSILYINDWLAFLSFVTVLFFTYTYKWLGLVLSSITSIIIYFTILEFRFLPLSIALLMMFSVGFILHFSIQFFRKHRIWKQLLLDNSKQLNILREITMAIQQTQDLERIIHIIVTSITAGHGLGFNRAMVFLHEPDLNALKGFLAIGPLDMSEGFEKWKDIARHKYRLIDLLDRIDKTDLDPELNTLVKQMHFSLNEKTVLRNVLISGDYQLIQTSDSIDATTTQLMNQFDMDELLIIPMIHQSKRIGLILIDNPVTKKPITESDIDNVMPLASQAALAVEQAKLYQDIEAMTFKDGLTNLFNQRALQRDLQSLFEGAVPQNLAMIMIDIDHFKHYNDTNGHLLGNDVLEKLAQTIKQTVPRNALSYRFGGEEFCVLCTDHSTTETFKIAENLRKTIEETSFPNENTQPNKTLTVTIGFAHISHISQANPSQLINCADDALYKGKNTGKNRVTSFEEVVKQ